MQNAKGKCYKRATRELKQIAFSAFDSHFAEQNEWMKDN